jgi:uncharacterized membrane protein HdeD (DUF308 family)
MPIFRIKYELHAHMTLPSRLICRLCHAQSKKIRQPESIFSKFITINATIITVSEVPASLAIIRARLNLRFPLAELALNRDAINFILTMLLFFLFQLFGVFRCYFLRSAKRRPGKPNSIFLAILAILAVTIDLVRMNRFGIETETLMIFSICSIRSPDSL